MHSHLLPTVMILVFRTTCGDYTPLTMVKDVKENTYELIDVDILRRYSLDDKNHQILQCCMKKLWLDNFLYLMVCMINQTISTNLKYQKCTSDTEPKIVVDPHEPHSFEIGYQIVDLREYLLLKKTHWIDVITVDFITGRLAVIGGSHHIYQGRHSKGEPRTCTDYTLGSIHFNDLAVDRLYEQPNQDKILQNVTGLPAIIPNTDTPADSKSLEKGKTTVQSPRYPLLVKHHLVPIDDFDVESERKTVCTHLNVTPIWESISTGSLLRLERYIRNVVDNQHIQALGILTGVHEILKLTFEIGSSEQQMYLEGDEKKIPIPRILYKMIGFIVPGDEQRQEETLIIFIIVHNELRELNADELLCESVCRQTGWDVENEDFLTGHTYCCDPTERLIDELGVEDNFKNVNTFNLRQFPIKKDGKWNTINISEKLTDSVKL